MARDLLAGMRGPDGVLGNDIEPEQYLDAQNAAAEEDPEYLAWCEEEEARGELAGAPETLECHVCKAQKKVAKLGPVAEAHRDPTQTYVLECGHTVI